MSRLNRIYFSPSCREEEQMAERLTIRCGSAVGAIRPDDMGSQRILQKLAYYEDLEESGRLIELPCAVGDTVYDIADKKIRKQIVDGIEYMADGFFIYANEDEWLGRLGDLVFLTKAEAEAALKESEKECINLL